MNYHKELETGIRAVKEAAALCSYVQKNLIPADSIEKNDRSPVTIADFGSQAILCNTIMRIFPGDSIVGEEESEELKKNRELSRKVAKLLEMHGLKITESEMFDTIDYARRTTDSSGRFWTLDPIDGTKGFLRNDQYAIALALVEDGVVKLGVLGCPNFSPDTSSCVDFGHVFYAVKGNGAHAIQLSTDQISDIHVDEVREPSDARICESVEKAHASHEEHAMITDELGITAESYRIDSQAKYAAVATGCASIYLRLPRSKTYREKIWDHAAGAILVDEAGGAVTDFKGNSLNFALGQKLEENEGILATNGYFHPSVLNAIAKVIR